MQFLDGGLGHSSASEILLVLSSVWISFSIELISPDIANNMLIKEMAGCIVSASILLQNAYGDDSCLDNRSLSR